MRADPDRVARLAAEWIGTPYRHQASARGQGADCLGVVRGIYRALHGAEPRALPPYTPHWHGEGEPLLEAAQAFLVPREAGGPDSVRPGDVLVFRMVPGQAAKHCGVLIEPGRFVHAYSGRAVVAARFSRWWQQRLAGVFSFPEVP